MSSSKSQRAFAGLSCGGFLAGSLMEKYPHAFRYFGVFSGAFLTPPTAAQLAQLHTDSIMVGGGLQDPIHSASLDVLNDLWNGGVGVYTDFINGGHEWYVWRYLLRDFVTRVAFLPNGS